MALVIYTQPKDYQPIHTPLMLEAGSDNTANIDFKYKVVITPVGFPVRTLYVSPRPIDARLEIDLSTHLRDYLDYDDFVLPAGSNFIKAPCVEYAVSVTESWEGVDHGSAVSVLSLTASNVLLDRQEWLQNKATDYNRFHIREDGSVPPGQPNPKLLLSKPLGATMYKDEYYLVHIVGRTDHDFMELRLNQYDAGGNLILPFTSITSGAGTTANRAVFARLDLSTIAFDPLTTRVMLTVLDGELSEVTESQFFDLKEHDCTGWERWKLFYMDKYGSYNNVSMDMISSSDFEVMPKTFRKRINPLTDSSRQRALTRYTQRTDMKYTLNTNILNRVQAEMIAELLESPRVYRDVRGVDGWGSSDFLPVEVLTTKLKPYAPGINDMPQYAIDVRYAFEKNTRHE